ncbi:NAD(P)H-dependent oxidoreductase [Stappia stellulata]|uniref:FMN-dependent NADH-azoreductase n=1 Tax=Stappia stellulata TaxID=71235 RepID=UPI001CD3F8C3|nr:NAD(P)H-dependent oxidoreductase [Stappia stellulata]MCA1242687.1 NAD(P)H-dependent oxidoreductase [Stappia stellulata]
MTKFLRVDASARRSRSLTRSLGDRFQHEWQSQRPRDKWTLRDLASEPPAHICEEWIAAAFTKEEARTPEQRAILAQSDRLIDELRNADVCLLTAPMYNSGMPSALKAWVDNVVRIGRTFSFDLARGDYPLEPLLAGKQMVLLTSAGEFGFAPGGVRQTLDHLVPHLEAIRHYLGVGRIHVVRVEYQEFGDSRHEASLREAQEATTALVAQLIRDEEAGAPQKGSPT